jgi:hypothetical protein
MRFMTLVKTAECGPPNPELIAAVGRLADEMSRAGVLIETGGLAPSAAGTRIRLARGGLTVVDGPFAETKEVVGGYAVLEAASHADAVALGRRFMQLHADILGPDHEAELEIRQMYGAPVAV